MCLEWIKGLDIFGKKVELQIEGRSSYKTYFGTIATLVFMGFVATISAPSCKEYLSTKQPGIVGESFKRSTYPEINLFDIRHLPILIAYSNEVDLITYEDMKRYFTLTVEKITWTETQNGDELGYNKDIKYTEPVPCGSLSQEELASYDYLHDEFLHDMFMQYAYCMPASSNLTVVGKGSDSVFVVISFKIKPCSLPNGVGCVTEQELGKANFMWINPMSTLDSSHYQSPRNKHANADDIYYINPGIRQMYTAKFKENVVLDLEGVFDPQPFQRTRYFDISDIFFTNAFRDGNKITCEFENTRKDGDACYSYFEYTFQSSGAIFNMRRSYKTFRDTLGEIGGIFEIMFMGFLFLVSPVVNWQYNKFIQSRVFKFGRDQRVLPLFSPPGSSELQTKSTEKVKTSKPWCCIQPRRDSSQTRLQTAMRQTLEKKTDFINIIQELNVLSLLGKVYLQQIHIKLAHLASLEDYMQKKNGSHEPSEKTGPPNTNDSLDYLNQNPNDVSTSQNKTQSPVASNHKTALKVSQIVSSREPSEYDLLLNYVASRTKSPKRNSSTPIKTIQTGPDEYFVKLFDGRAQPSKPPSNIPTRILPRRTKKITRAQIEQVSPIPGETTRKEKILRL
jgi:hypothetical protein